MGNEKKLEKENEFIKIIFTKSRYVDTKKLIDVIYRIGDYLQNNDADFSDDYVKNQIEYFLSNVDKNKKNYDNLNHL